MQLYGRHVPIIFWNGMNMDRFVYIALFYYLRTCMISDFTRRSVRSFGMDMEIWYYEHILLDISNWLDVLSNIVSGTIAVQKVLEHKQSNLPYLTQHLSKKKYLVCIMQYVLYKLYPLNQNRTCSEWRASFGRPMAHPIGEQLYTLQHIHIVLKLLYQPDQTGKWREMYVFIT